MKTKYFYALFLLCLAMVGLAFGAIIGPAVLIVVAFIILISAEGDVE